MVRGVGLVCAREHGRGAEGEATDVRGRQLQAQARRAQPSAAQTRRPASARLQGQVAIKAHPDTLHVARINILVVML